MTAPVRWGFIGAGWIAHRALGPAVHCADGAVLHAAAARDVDRARSLSPTVAYGAYEHLLGDDEVEAVYISLHNSAHMPLTLAALEAGKHVLCEKPLGLTADEVAQMADAAARADRLLVEATWTRWHPRTQRAQALLATDAIGDVRSVDVGFCFEGVAADNYRLDAAHGGGALYDLGPYSIGSVLWAVPDAPVTVVDVAVDRHPGGVDLTTQATVRVGEATASARSSVDEDSGEWLRIEGTRGALEFSRPAHVSWLAPSTLSVWQSSDAPADGEPSFVHHFAPVDPYQLMAEHVSRAIRGDRSAYLLPVEESLRVAHALDAIRTAASGAAEAG